MKNLLAILIASFLASGCSHYMPAAVSSTSLGPKEHPIAIVSSESTAYYVFGIGPFGDDSIQAAIDKIRSRKDFDTMINMVVDRREICFPICAFSIATTVSTLIYGTLIKYDDPSVKDIPRLRLIETEDQSGKRLMYLEQYPPPDIETEKDLSGPTPYYKSPNPKREKGKRGDNDGNVL